MLDGLLEASWELFWAMLARTGGPGGLLGAFGTKNQKKRRKTGPFWLFLERLGKHFGAHVGSKRPSWLHLGRLGLDYEAFG